MTSPTPSPSPLGPHFPFHIPTSTPSPSTHNTSYHHNLNPHITSRSHSSSTYTHTFTPGRPRHLHTHRSPSSRHHKEEGGTSRRSQVLEGDPRAVRSSYGGVVLQEEGKWASTYSIIPRSSRLPPRRCIPLVEEQEVLPDTSTNQHRLPARPPLLASVSQTLVKNSCNYTWLGKKNEGSECDGGKRRSEASRGITVPPNTRSAGDGTDCF
ncbi:hypothetical protein O3P69_004227 [Scylla paramamosain]|uniref:Uncharacterized protein n=1 Tax=Scylla paramamosain TaxID=85552 RepID=A0AAW0UFP1_SCYPA